jgi:hypothetical protein
LLCAGAGLDVAALFKGRECRTADPAKLASLKVSKLVPRTAWLLNGGSARRAGEPPRQIGVTLEQAAVLSSERTVVEPAVMRATTPETGGLHAVTPSPGPHPEAPTYPPTTQIARPQAWAMHMNIHDSYVQEPGVNDNRSAVTLDAAVMAEYFETMRQFLETQGQVMAALLGEGAPRPVAAAARTVQRIAPARMAEPVRRAPMPPAQERTSAPVNGAAHAPVNGAAYAPPVAAAAPVAPQPAVAAQAPARVEAPEPAPARSSTVAKIAPAGDAVMDRGKLTSVLLDIVEEKTGYPKDMVGLDQNLEADLGIDSIKRIEVVGAMLQTLPEKQREALTAHRSKLNTQSTLNGMLELLTSSIERAAAA